jgi:hypothetical protein
MQLGLPDENAYVAGTTLLFAGIARLAFWLAGISVKFVVKFAVTLTGPLIVTF